MNGSTRSFRSAMVVAALFALVLVPTQMVSGPVEAAVPTGAISGTVTNSGGAPLAGIVVSADTYYTAFATATTDQAGRYSISSLPVGSYQLQFSPPNGSPYAGEWYNNKPFPYQGVDKVAVVAGVTTQHIDAVLDLGGVISGTVTGPDGTALNSATVCVYGTTAGYAGCTTSAATGRYTTPSLAAGNYKVSFSPPSLSTLSPEYFDDASGYAGAAVLPVTAGTNLVGVNARLQGPCSAFGSGCTWLTSTSKCIQANWLGGRTVKLNYLCGASSVTWTDADGHSSVANPAILTYSTVGPWTVNAAASVGGSVYPDSIVIQFPAAGALKVPDPPTGVTGVAGNASAAVSWVAPVNDGGSPIAGYTVTAAPGGASCVWLSGPLGCSVAGLANGVGYTFTVTASNGTGSSVPSVASAPVTPMTVPGAPDGVVALPGNTQAQISWAAPASNGGSAITSYTATASPGGATCTWSSGPLTCAVTGLSNGVPYTFSVRAQNSVGPGAASAPSTPVTPSAITIPGAPTGVVAAGGKLSAVVSWVAPVSDGGAAISGYVVTASPGGAVCSWVSGPLSCVVSGLSAGASYSFTVRAVNSAGPGAVSVASNAVTPWDGSGYHPVTPSRILDSRGVNGGWNAQLVSGAPRDLVVTGLGGGSNVPASATAVVMNTTVTGGSSGSFVTVYPAGTATPNASNLNFGAGETIANLVTVKLGVGGKVSFANALGSTDVIADVVGYYDDGSGQGDLYTGITPTRLLDSRTTNGGWNAKLTAGGPRDLVVRQPGNGAGVPATATAVIANVTVTGGSAGSFVSVWPSGVAQPNVSNLNFGAGQTIPNLAIIKIGANGAISFANAVGGVDVIVDVVGYFDPTGGSRFHAINPTRVLDDRVPTGLAGPWGAGVTRGLPVAGAVGTNVPAGATGLVTNVTATGGTAGSFISVFPDGVAVPNSSNVNFGPGQTIPNLVTVKIAANGKIAFYNKLGSVDIIADAVGYYATT